MFLINSFSMQCLPFKGKDALEGTGKVQVRMPMKVQAGPGHGDPRNLSFRSQKVTEEF